jgi:hypothetical protein
MRRMSVNTYMVTAFIDALRKAIQDGGLMRYEQGQEEVRNGRLLIAYRGCLFAVGGRLDIEEAAAPYHAIGSGAPAALGALYASDGRDPFERVLCALEAAERINTTVRRPFTILCQRRHQHELTIEVLEYSYTVQLCSVHRENALGTDAGTSNVPAA